MVLAVPNPAPRQHQTAPNRIGSFNPIDKNKTSGPPRTFTANAAGTTTTILGPDADATDFFVGDKFCLYTSVDVLKEDTVFTVTAKGSGAGTTTLTFTPAAAGATASGNYAAVRADLATLANPGSYMDVASARQRLKAINAGLYTDLRLDTMNINDMRYAIRLADESDFN